MTTEKFLNNVSQKLHSLPEKKNSCTEAYNIFDVLNVGEKEVIMCRFLADLLNPKGKHGCGTIFLHSFLKECNVKGADELILENTVVETEYPIDNQRRIDIVVYNKDFFLPIEVKINAKEQENQCLDYYSYVTKQHPNSKLVYLTKFGTAPSLKSTGGSKAVIDNMICISFANNIRTMMEDNIAKISNAASKSAAEQFFESIKKHSDPLWKEKEDMFEEMYNDPEIFKAAVEFEKHLPALNRRKTKIITDLMTVLEAKIDLKIVPIHNLKKLEKDTYYNYKLCSDTPYSSKLYPGFAYLINTFTYNGKEYELRFRVEVAENLFMGMCVFDVEYQGECKIKSSGIVNELCKYIKRANENESYWADYVYLPSGTPKAETDKTPNFKEMNDAAIKLCKKEEIEAFVDCSVEKINYYLKNTLK